MRNFLKGLFLVFLLSGCFSKAKEEPRAIFYFDLKGYFTRLADKLNQQNPQIYKTVSKNNSAESKSIKIPNWKEEFALFINADINKAAWKDSYSKDSTASKIVYTTKDPDLKTQKILINLKDGKPTRFYIETKVSNLLYQTSEKLAFFPDSLYEIEKSQKVIFLGNNNYEIIGKLK